jgi:1,2-diacylglycerol 3-beta-glucosyltransferase
VTAFVGVHLLLIFLSRPKNLTLHPAAIDLSPENTHDSTVPFVSLLVAAKNEEAVIASLVDDLCRLQYPGDRYELWVVDDASSDNTPQLLDTLAKKYSKLNVLHRSANAGGGKSGALNDVLSLAKGDILGVFDADAQVDSLLLQSVVPLFQHKNIGAIQLRKATMNWADNFWTRNQAVEMLFDSFIQSHSVAVGGIGELRGNGQFVRRSALAECDGWNEQTITDDLDLTLRLHLKGWDIHFLINPAIGEEGVTSGKALWHQRSRWAEGGYQRYLDYWRLIIRNRLGLRKSIDLMVFLLLQYIVPTAALPDVLMAIARNRIPVLSPLTTVIFLFSFLFMTVGVGQFRSSRLIMGNQALINQDATLSSFSHSPSPTPSSLSSLESTPIFKWVKSSLRVLWASVQGTLYLMHWIPIVATTTFRLAIRPKRLKWVKTDHSGKNPARNDH